MKIQGANKTTAAIEELTELLSNPLPHRIASENPHNEKQRLDKLRRLAVDALGRNRTGDRFRCLEFIRGQNEVIMRYDTKFIPSDIYYEEPTGTIAAAPTELPTDEGRAAMPTIEPGKSVF